MSDEIEQAFREGYIEGQKETAELKRMLRVAYYVLDNADICDCCSCAHRNEIVKRNTLCQRIRGETGYCPRFYKWEHADEAEKLLEGKGSNG